MFTVFQACDKWNMRQSFFVMPTSVLCAFVTVLCMSGIFFQGVAHAAPKGTAAFQEGEATLEQAQKAHGKEKEALREKATRSFKKAVQENPHHTKAWSSWGEVLFSQYVDHKSDDAELAGLLFLESSEVYADGVAQNPDDSYLWYMWGSNLALRAYDLPTAQRKAMRLDAGVKFSEAIRTDPRDEYTWRMWGKLSWRMADELSPSMEKTDLLQDAYNKILAAYTITPKKSAFLLARLSGALERKEECKAFFAEAITLDEVAMSAEELRDSEEFQSVSNEGWFKKFIAE